MENSKEFKITHNCRYIKQNRNCSQEIRSETAQTLKNSAGRAATPKHGQDLRSRTEQEI